MQKQKQGDGQVEEEVELWKSEKQMGKYYEGDEEVKTETQLIDDFLNRGLVYEDEIDRTNKTITIGNRVIDYGVDGSVELDPDVDLEDDTGKEAFIAEITPLGPFGEEQGVPEELLGKYYAVVPIGQYCYEYTEYGEPKMDKNTQANNDLYINWGDGSNEHITNESFENDFLPGYIYHFYDNPGTYEIQITGKCESLIMEELGIAFNVKVKQWGVTGLKSIYAYGMAQNDIPKPSKSSFKDLECAVFMKCQMTSIPEYLFANCFKMKNFNFTFYKCANLQEIPGNIFANCINAETFMETFAECTQINKIGENLFAQCYNATNFDATFGGIAITEIPETLFKNNSKSKSFFGTFAQCTELTSVPLTLFDNCQNVEIFKGTFNSCEKLTGEVPKLWLRGDNSGENNYEGEKPNGGGCYGGCANINGYLDIPDYWRELYYS